jgi:hypothetical protein
LGEGPGMRALVYLIGGFVRAPYSLFNEHKKFFVSFVLFVVKYKKLTLHALRGFIKR